MEEGILLTIVFVIFVVIAAIILTVVSFSLITSFGTLGFGLNCFTSFTQYKIVNTFLAPFTGITSALGISNIAVSPTQSSQVQKNCLQNTNIDENSVSGFASQFYTQASSCFSLFASGNAAVGSDIISAKNLNQMFNCYDGSIITSNDVNYSSIISYIDTNYNGSYPLQIVFITNGSNGNAQYASPSDKLINGSYIVTYFGYPSKGTNNCQISFKDQCTYTSEYDQPIISNKNSCNNLNQTTNSTFETVSSLSNGNPSKSIINENSGCDYYVPLCGKLSNYMVYSQSRVFVCIPQS
ncbi:MAG: hypothetical protein BJBARM5_0310 [Candidatus Parvarchaeum acidophilus ARMAN-5]|jgi:hypothetical protein|uniref:Uncharacterized protein n=1 Tax=Candidatus Parvarchaeum acidophilus ARMAN-5 TaxID=662762 RepID=D6GV10_PARA5|nr:MAG: hypothetical protein BJBARM5_0310 [Candidatus Parvarchaeum acidophilus ARMAN-5]